MALILVLVTSHLKWFVSISKGLGVTYDSIINSGVNFHSQVSFSFNKRYRYAKPDCCDLDGRIKDSWCGPRQIVASPQREIIIFTLFLAVVGKLLEERPGPDPVKYIICTLICTLLKFRRHYVDHVE